MKITQITNNRGRLTKKYVGDSKDNCKSHKAPNLFDGSFETLSLQNLEGLKNIIEGLSTSQALIYSRPELTKGLIAKKGYENPDTDTISKTKECFDYYEEPGILCIDIDSPGETEDSVIKKLADCHKSFGKTSYLYSTSASNGISGKTGFHLYFRVDDSSSIPQAMKELFKISFNKGYGYHKVSKSGALLERSFFDLAIYDRGRLDFIGGIVTEGFEAPQRDIRVVTKSNEVLALDPLLATIDADKAIAKSKESSAKAQGIIIKKVAKAKGISEREYKKILETNVLPWNHVWPDGATLKDYEGKDQAVPHPIEGGYQEKTIFFWNNGSPVISTFAHGGAKYRFEESVEKVTLPSEHPKTGEVIALMKDTYSKRGLQVPEKTVRPFISIMLHQVLEDYKGCFSVQLRPSGGKTQCILHLALWLSRNTDKSLSITFQKKEDINQAVQWLQDKGVSCLPIHADSDFKKKDVKDSQIIIHTHFRVRDNNYTDNYYTYKGKPRDLFLFDEAYMGTLSKSMTLKDAILVLQGAITEEEAKPRGLPRYFLEELMKRLKRANRLLGKPHVSYVEIPFPRLEERFVETAWRINENADVLHCIFLIAAADEKMMVANKSKGSSRSILLFKANQSATFDKMITTDATRDIRAVHKLSPQKITKIPLYEDRPRADKWYVLPLLPDSKTASLEYTGTDERLKTQSEILKLTLQSETYNFCITEKIHKLGLIHSKAIPFIASEWPPGTVSIPYGQHKQTDKFSECDGLAFLHLHRIPRGALEHQVMAESQSLELPVSLRKFELGQMADEIIQGAMRGQRRKNKSCPVFIPVRGEYGLLNILSRFFKEDDWHLIGEDKGILYTKEQLRFYESLTHYESFKKPKEKRSERSDKKYSNRQRNQLKNLRRTARKKHIDLDEVMEGQFLRDKAQGSAAGPVGWLKDNVKPETVTNVSFVEF